MNYELNMRLLRDDVLHGNKIVLILGAGVNVSQGVRLQWNQLINPIFKNAIRQICEANELQTSEYHDLLGLFDIEKPTQIKDEVYSSDSYMALKNKVVFDYAAPMKMAIAKNVLGGQYLYILQDYIYNECNRNLIEHAFRQCYKADCEVETEAKSGKTENKPFYTLYTVAKMILVNPNIVGVITYNYDNFLTIAIDVLQSDIHYYFKKEELAVVEERLKNTNGSGRIEVMDVYGSKKDIAQGNTLFVFHPHGYIPPPSEAERLEKYNIVFSQDEYNDTTWESYSWSNDTQVHLISHYTSIIIGSSFSDFTTQRMLHYANKNANGNKRYYIGAYPLKDKNMPEWLRRAECNLTQLKSRYFESIGLTPVICPNGYEKVFDRINSINNEYAKVLSDELQLTNKNHYEKD